MVDEEQPQAARIHDYYLGGRHHFAADREAAAATMRRVPSVPKAARANRHFLHVAVEHLAREHGVDQFVDVGAGIPTEPNLHQLAQFHQPQARVAYVDHDPRVLPYAEALLTSSSEGRVDYLEADLRRPAELLDHPSLAGPEPVVDLRRPVALCVVAMLHLVTDEEKPGELLGTLLAPLASGSSLVLSHASADFTEVAEEAPETDHGDGRRSPARLRSREEVEELVTAAGAELVEPGVQPLAQWWPGRPAHLAPIALCRNQEAAGYGVLARKP